MNDWIPMEDKEAWDKRPNKIEILFPDGRIGQISVYPIGKDPASSAGLIMDSICLSEENATHWRPIKK
jgi:hypothetical protein